MSYLEEKLLEMSKIADKQQEEIERLKVRISKQRQANEKLQAKYDLVHSIIKEVREYIEEMNVWCIEFENFGVGSKELLEILDKVDKENV